MIHRPRVNAHTTTLRSKYLGPHYRNVRKLVRWAVKREGVVIPYTIINVNIAIYIIRLF